MQPVARFIGSEAVFDRLTVLIIRSYCVLVKGKTGLTVTNRTPVNSRLLEIQKEQQEQLLVIEQAHARLAALHKEANEILTEIKHVKSLVPLTFSPNAITWGNGQKLVLKGKGRKFILALYKAKKMRLKEGTLGKRIWGKEGEPTHNTFTEYVRWLSLKLEKAKFPYRLLPARSKQKMEETGEKFRNGKPKPKYVPPEIIGVKLCPR